MSQGNHPSIIGEAISKGLTPDLVDSASVTARESRAALDVQELRDLEAVELYAASPEPVAPKRRTLLDRILRRL